MRTLENVRNISSNKSWLLILLGLLIGAFVLFNASKIGSFKEVKTEQEPQPSKDAAIGEKVEAVPAQVQTPPEKQSYLIQILPNPKPESGDEVGIDKFFPAPYKIFEVLFKLIISPNAP